MTVTKSQVMGWNLQPFADIATDADKITTAIDTMADKMHRTIYDLEWSGQAYGAATDRAEDEKQQMRKVGSAYFQLAEACRSVFGLQVTVTDAQNTVRSLEAAGQFRVDDDWTVHAAAEADENEAQNNAIKLKGLASHLDSEDARLGPIIAAAVTEISAMAPVAATLCNPHAYSDMSADSAKDDLRDFEDGTATPEQVARLELATQLSPEQLAALQRGEQVDMPAEQFQYLQALMRGQDGMTMDQIEGLGSRMPDGDGAKVQAAMADAMQIVSNPQVHADGGNRGGMQQLPDRVRDLLVETPYHQSRGGPWVDKRGFTSLTHIINRGEPALASGSDLDRGLLKQAAEIVKIDDHRNFGELDGLGSVADKMLYTASRDHHAVSDFITGDGMQATVNSVGHYDTDDHFMSVLAHDWGDDEHGAEKLFNWIDDAADDPDPKVAANAGHTADALARRLVADSDHLALNLPGHGGESLGKVNPGVTQALAESMTPYLGNFVNAPDSMLVNHTAGSFDQVGDLTKLFDVLDSDPVAAKTINAAGSQWNDYLAYQAGMNPDQAPSLGQRSGQISQAMSDGFQNQLKHLDEQNKWEYTQDYNHKAAASDTVTTLVGALPGVSETMVPALLSSGNSWFKVDVLDVPGDPTNPQPDDELAGKLKKDITGLTQPDTLRREYCLASGYSQIHPEIISSFDTRPPGAQGPYPNLLLSWSDAKNNSNQFLNMFGAIDDPGLKNFGAYFRDGRDDPTTSGSGGDPGGTIGAPR